MRADTGSVLVVSLCLALHSFIFSSPSGVPGKKCGTIILSAEELSNCRVSGRGTPGQDLVEVVGVEWGQAGILVTPRSCVSLEGTERQGSSV